MAGALLRAARDEGRPGSVPGWQARIRRPWQRRRFSSRRNCASSCPGSWRPRCSGGWGGGWGAGCGGQRPEEGSHPSGGVPATFPLAVASCSQVGHRGPELGSPFQGRERYRVEIFTDVGDLVMQEEAGGQLHSGWCSRRGLPAGGCGTPADGGWRNSTGGKLASPLRRRHATRVPSSTADADGCPGLPEELGTKAPIQGDGCPLRSASRLHQASASVTGEPPAPGGGRKRRICSAAARSLHGHCSGHPHWRPLERKARAGPRSPSPCTIPTPGPCQHRGQHHQSEVQGTSSIREKPHSHPTVSVGPHRMALVSARGSSSSTAAWAATLRAEYPPLAPSKEAAGVARLPTRAPGVRDARRNAPGLPPGQP